MALLFNLIDYMGSGCGLTLKDRRFDACFIQIGQFQTAYKGVYRFVFDQIDRAAAKPGAGQARPRQPGSAAALSTRISSSGQLTS